MVSNVYFLTTDVSKRDVIEETITKNHRGDHLFTLLRYIKDFISFNDEKIKKYRSVIFSFPCRKLLCFAPPSIPILQKTTLSDETGYYINPQKFIINEYIDGLMLNLFFDKRSLRWELSLKDSIVENQVYNYKQPQSMYGKRYMDIFKEKIRHNGDLQSSCVLEQLSKKHCYSFTCSFSDDNIYLVAVYEIHDTHAVFINADDYENWKCFTNLNGVICFPKRSSIHSNTFNEIETDICSRNIDGVVYTSIHNGNRFKIVNHWYKIRRLLRQVSEFNMFMYLCLRGNKCDLIRKKLYMYTKERKLYYNFIEYLYDLYIKYYQNKEPITIVDKWACMLDDIHNETYKNNMIHKMRRTQLKKKDLFKYFEKKHQLQVLFLMEV